MAGISAAAAAALDEVSEADAEGFARSAHAVTMRLWPWMGVVVAAAAVLWWPLDLLLYAGQPQVQQGMALFRVLILAFNLPISLLGFRLSFFRSQPFFWLILVMMMDIAVAGWCMAEAGQGSPLWFAYGYLLPQFSVLLLLPLRARVGAVLAILAVFWLSWEAHPAASLRDPGVASGASFQVFCVLIAVGIGHAFFLVLRRDFALRQTVERQRADLLALTERLEARVSQQTRALREMHHRAQELRAEQRQEIARDLHDGLGQELTSLRLIGGLGRSITPPGEVHDLFAELDGQVAQVQGSLRRVLIALQPQLLDEHGLIEALRLLLRDLKRRSGVHLSLHLLDVPEPLPVPVSVALFRICQEGLNNALRHARAHAIEVHLTGTREGLCLEIVDDGVGLSKNAVGAGLGTRSILERAEALGGAACWLSPAPAPHPPQGTLLRVTLPLSEAP